ncbi:MAG: NAD-dependent epimerase/dehydratase family protein [bacterium]
MKAFVTGGAGFVGSTLADRLLQAGHHVTVFDNLSTGFKEHLAGATKNPAFKLVQGDLLQADALTAAMKGSDTVFHLAANADVRFGTTNPRRDLDQNTIGTFHVLEAMRQNNVGRIMFSSTGAIYGECKVIPTPEDAPFPVQTSLYGASKLAGEGMIQAYCEAFGVRGYIFRFVSILGERYSHGHVYDFYRQLRQDPTRMPVLGDGTQKKSYLYVQDCVDAILVALDKAQGKINVFNLGTDEYCAVTQSIGYICERLGISPKLEFAGGDRGWAGDNPFTFLDCKRIRTLGWAPRTSIRDGIIRTLEYLVKNPWILESRD